MFIDNYVLANLSILHVKLKSQYTMKNDVLKKKKKRNSKQMTLNFKSTKILIGSFIQHRFCFY